MKTDFLFLAQGGFAALPLVCLVLVVAGAYRTFLSLGLGPAVAARKTIIIGALLLGWLAFASALSLSGFMGNFALAPLNMVPALLPPLAAVLVLTFHPRTQGFIRHLPARGLLYLQAFRVPVEVFLWWLFLANALPERMTFEGRNWDVLSGLAGPLFAVLCYGGTRYRPRLALLYHLAGLGLLLHIVLTGVLSLPTPFQVYKQAPGAEVMVSFPVMFLPTFLVPLAYALHFFSLRKAALEKREVAANHQQLAVTAS
ncbi:hypothetical protein [Rufibacter psychrotolerans]|uniref:hypothetical protein n=1 Tax=Rufibacter psychrotolerans TaxID=2812556 RepID=UPI0019671A57|nr:hypothetical protein [Rufibacter sp. SYSU D00308]